MNYRGIHNNSLNIINLVRISSRSHQADHGIRIHAYIAMLLQVFQYDMLFIVAISIFVIITPLSVDTVG